MERILELLEEGIREGRHKQTKGEINHKLLQRTYKLFGIDYEDKADTEKKDKS